MLPVTPPSSGPILRRSPARKPLARTYSTCSTNSSDAFGLVLCLARTHLLERVCHRGLMVSLGPNFTCLIISPIFPPKFGCLVAFAESQKKQTCLTDTGLSTSKMTRVT